MVKRQMLVMLNRLTEIKSCNQVHETVTISGTADVCYFEKLTKIEKFVVLKTIPSTVITSIPTSISILITTPIRTSIPTPNPSEISIPI